MIYDHFWLGCIRKSEQGTLELWSFLDSNDQWQGKAGSDRYDGLKNFSDEGCSLDLIQDLEDWFLEYLNLDFHIG
jgi:hypothetical protein